MRRHVSKSLVRLARASPGKLTYSSAGVGTTFHFCGEMFKDATGTFTGECPCTTTAPKFISE